MINIKQLTRQFLLEGLDIDKTWANHGQNISKRMFDEDIPEAMEPKKHKEVFHQALISTDPTEHKEYAPWIASRYAKGGINSFEDFPRVRHALEQFHKGKVKKQMVDAGEWTAKVKAENQANIETQRAAHQASGATGFFNPVHIPFEQHIEKHGIPNDVNTTKSLSELEDLTRKIPSDENKLVAMSTKEIPGATVHDSEHWTTVVPHTQEAADVCSQGSSWCTRTAYGSSQFNSYSSRGPLHVMIPKKPAYSGEKYQFHMDTNRASNYASFMDERDRPASYKVFGDRPNPALTAHVKAHMDKAPPNLKAGIATMGTDEDRAALIHDQSWDVQHAISLHGNAEHKAQAGRWVDEHFDQAPLEARKEVAKFGPDHLRDRLAASDQHQDVQSLIAKHGTESQKDKLLDNPQLNNTIIKGLIEGKKVMDPEAKKYQDRFISHPEHVVRALVAKHGTPEHRKQLLADKSMIVYETVKKAMKDYGET